MKRLFFFEMMLFTCVLAAASDTMPLGNKMDEMPIAFFADKGFEFDVDDSMQHLYEKPTVEISIVIPEHFTHMNEKYNFDYITFSHAELNICLDDHPYNNKKRSIITISVDMANKSDVIFYFEKKINSVNTRTMFTLNLSKVLEYWEKKQKNLNSPVITKKPWPVKIEHLLFDGGDGSSMAQAVIIKNAKNEEDGVRAESRWISEVHPDWRKGKQATLIEKNGKHYDQIEYKAFDGMTKTVFFDITDFWGK